MTDEFEKRALDAGWASIGLADGMLPGDIFLAGAKWARDEIHERAILREQIDETLKGLPLGNDQDWRILLGKTIETNFWLKPENAALKSEIERLKLKLHEAEDEIEDHKFMRQEITKHRDELAETRMSQVKEIDRLKGELDEAVITFEKLNQTIREKDVTIVKLIKELEQAKGENAELRKDHEAMFAGELIPMVIAQQLEKLSLSAESYRAALEKIADRKSLLHGISDDDGGTSSIIGYARQALEEEK
jgi:hypothetical protein